MVSKRYQSSLGLVEAAVLVQGWGYTRVKRDLTRVKRIYHPLNLDGGRNWNNPGEMSIPPPNSSPPPQITPLVPYRYLRYYMYR